MSDFKFPTPALAKNHGELLDVIDQLREHGVDRHLPLPQLIVCGDQSSGKSSVLEAISGWAFPTAEGCCTRFVTELVLRRGSTSSHSVTTISGKSKNDERSEDEFHKLQKFQVSNSLQEFKEMVEEAKVAIELESSTEPFSDDVLKVEITDSTQPNLTLVDLPGVFHSGPGAAFVKTLVQKYMKSQRSIILAVVSARSDLELQLVTEMTQQIDPKGHRTLGIVTKVDDIKGLPDIWLKLIRNERFNYRLGWHALRNRDNSEAHFTREERNAAEKTFFSNNPWTSLPREFVGVETLIPRLSTIQKNQIILEIPHLIADMEEGIASCEATLEQLGSERDTFDKQKRYLTHISTQFTALTKASIDGLYNHEFFNKSQRSRVFDERLRAVVQKKLLAFAETIHERGHQYKILPESTITAPSQSSVKSPVRFADDDSSAEDTDHDDETDCGSVFSDSSEPPHEISESAYIHKVSKYMERSRGRELPGCFNPLIIGDLFLRQSTPWKKHADELSADLLDSTRKCLLLIVQYVADESTQVTLFRELIEPQLAILKTKLETKVADILCPYTKSHPITYNHYFTETVQDTRKKLQRKTQKAQLLKLCSASAYGGHKTLQNISLELVLDALAIKNKADMDWYACSEAMHHMQSYYKVALKNFIDSVAASGFENTVLDALPDIVTPETIMGLDEETITLIAGETAESQTERKRATEKLKSLVEGKKALIRVQRQNPAGRIFSTRK